MNNGMGRVIVWLVGASCILLLALSLSCCKSSEDGGTTPAKSEAGGGESGRPAGMVDALARGKKEKKMVVIELFDKECVYSLQVQGSLRDKAVLQLLSDMVHTKVTVEDHAVIEEFGLMESPTFLFFTPEGEYMEPYVQGFRSPHVLAAEIKNYKLRFQGKDELPVPPDPHPDYGKG